MLMLPRWQEPFLGLAEIPRGLTDLEIGYFFRFSAAEREAIASRRGDYHQLAAALQLAGSVINVVIVISRRRDQTHTD